MTLQGRRRRPRSAKFPRDIRPGDYWPALTSSGERMTVEEPGNLTGEVWWIAAPMPSGGYGLGRLTKHTVREHPDGTISVRPGDGSSNSILMSGSNGQSYHGYIDHGVWSDA